MVSTTSNVTFEDDSECWGWATTLDAIVDDQCVENIGWIWKYADDGSWTEAGEGLGIRCLEENPIGCSYPEWANDEYCDDINNTPECDYDGGACCPGDNPAEGWDDYCTLCECRNDNDAPGCVFPDWSNDGYCDDINNTPDCGYDGGDCCPGDNPEESWNQFCSDCECLTDGEKTTTSASATTTANSQCQFEWISDNYCDDINNIPECNYDGGDCCQEDNDEHGWLQYCTICKCHDKIDTSGCAKPDFAIDFFCDDENNTPECEYDGGACCFGNYPVAGWPWDQFCSDCECQNMNATTTPGTCATKLSRKPMIKLINQQFWVV